MYSRKARDMHTPALSLTYCESFSLRNYLSMDKVARPMYLEAYDPRLSSPGPPSFHSHIHIHRPWSSPVLAPSSSVSSPHSIHYCQRQREWESEPLSGSTE